MIFRRRQPPELTNDGYRRWLRAQRPPFEWFLELGEEDQETLAMIGDRHVQDFCVGLGYAIADPQIAEAGIDAEADADSEEVLLRRLAAEIASQGLRRTSAPPPSSPAPLTMGGVTKRRAERAARRKAERNVGRTFLGKEPDPVQHVADEVIDEPLADGEAAPARVDNGRVAGG